MPPISVKRRRRGRLVDNTNRLQIGDLTGLAHCLALGVGEIGRQHDHRLEPLENDDCRDFLRHLIVARHPHRLGLTQTPLDRRAGCRRNGAQVGTRRQTSPNLASWE